MKLILLNTEFKCIFFQAGSQESVRQTKAPGILRSFPRNSLAKRGIHPIRFETHSFPKTVVILMRNLSESTNMSDNAIDKNLNKIQQKTIWRQKSYFLRHGLFKTKKNIIRQIRPSFQ